MVIYDILGTTRTENGVIFECYGGLDTDKAQVVLRVLNTTTGQVKEAFYPAVIGQQAIKWKILSELMKR